MSNLSPAAPEDPSSAGEGRQPFDCIIVGGGPAGLTAAIYLARFHLRILVIDAGDGRALSIPRTHNHAGYPGGISGRALLARMRRQAITYGATFLRDCVTEARRDEDGFCVATASHSFRSASLLLATGVSNRRPAMSERMHARALRQGLLRYCPICDGYEVTDRKVAVLGTGAKGVAEARFLRSFTADMTLISPFPRHDLGAAEREEAAALGIALVDGGVPSYDLAPGQILIRIGKQGLAFDTLYPALGSDPKSGLALQLGLDLSGDRCIATDSHQRTSIPGLYAAGDVVKGLDQISHAMGEGGVAATTIRNDLAQRAPLLRQPAPLKVPQISF